MIKSIDLRQDEVARGAALRHAQSLFEGDLPRFHPARATAPSEIGGGDGIEQCARRDGRQVFSLRFAVLDRLGSGCLVPPNESSILDWVEEGRSRNR